MWFKKKRPGLRARKRPADRRPCLVHVPYSCVWISSWLGGLSWCVMPPPFTTCATNQQSAKSMRVPWQAGWAYGPPLVAERVDELDVVADHDHAAMLPFEKQVSDCGLVMASRIGGEGWTLNDLRACVSAARVSLSR